MDDVTRASLRKTSVMVEALAANPPGRVQRSAGWRAAGKARPERVSRAMCFKDFPGKNVTRPKRQHDREYWKGCSPLGWGGGGLLPGFFHFHGNRLQIL